MARDIRSPLFEAEPFEESQGRQAVASADELHKFYSDMERRELAQRRLSRNKSSARPRWRGKSAKSAVAAMQPIEDKSTEGLLAEKQGLSVDESHTPPTLMEDELRGSQLLDPAYSTSIIPDSTPPPGIPSPFSSSPQSSYVIHNPGGPRWYTNHHLFPPHARVPLPPSFSPSFPPMPRADDSGRMPGPSRTPSGSPLPTPNSSQTRIPIEGAPGIRSRKVSQTAHDGVDLMDRTDPWGTNWHHDSPYDIGINPGPGQTAQTNSDLGQTRRNGKISSSNSSQIHRKTGTPSPLSQSTSAVHLQAEVVAAPITRSQSKRKAGFRRTIFGGSSNTSSAPVMKTTESSDTSNRRLSIANEGILVKRKPSKKVHQVPHSISTGTASSYPVHELSSLPSYAPEGKEKRLSMFNRLTRRFSILRRPTMTFEPSDDKKQTLVDADSKSSSPMESKDVLESLEKTSEEMRRKSPNLAKRIPPPTLNDGTKADTAESKTDIVGKRSSESISIEPTLKSGKLTIANPDVESNAARSARSSDVVPPTNLDVADTKVGGITKEEEQGISVQGGRQIDNRPSSDVEKVEALPVSPTESHPPLVPEKDNKDDFPKQKSTKVVEDAILEERPLTPPPVKPFAVARDNSETSSADHSPVSKASILANPPTPHLLPIAMPPPLDLSTTAEAPFKRESLQEASQRDSQLRHDDGLQNRSPKKDKAKQPVTETFKLVRSSSEHAKRNSQIVTVGEEQWELVEVPESTRKRRTSKDKDRSKSKEAERSPPRKDSSRRHERSQSDVRADQEKARERASQKGNGVKSRDLTEAPKSSHRGSRAQSLEPPTRRTSDIGNQTANARKGRSPEKAHSSNRDRHSSDITAKPSVNSDALDSRPPLNASYLRVPRPTLTQRPVSDTPTSAEWTTLSAKEAWEADRMWKGKSVLYGPEVIGVVSSPNVTSYPEMTYGIVSGQSAVKSSDAVYDVGYGSSHTAYVVQRPFQGQTIHQNSFYSQTPTPQPPPFYHLPIANNPTYVLPGFYNHPNAYHSFPDTGAKSSNTPSRVPLSNPLPEPPRISPYKPPLLPAIQANGTTNDDDPSTAEYWNKFAGISPTH